MSQPAPAEITSMSSYLIHALATADTAHRRPAIGTRARRAGLVVGAIPIVFLAMDAMMKLLAVAPAVEGTAQLGYPPHVLQPLGIVQAVCLALYVLPRTSVLGAILWTGYLGGAVATHVRVGSPLFTHMLFPVLVGGLLWLALWLRDARVRALIPLS